MDSDGWNPRKLTHLQARMEQHQYWAGKTVAERLAAAEELSRRMYRMRGIVLQESKRPVLLGDFCKAGVDYVMVDEAAMIAHGYVHATSSTKLFIRPTVENAEAAYRVMVGLGIPYEGIAPFDLLYLDAPIRLGPDEDHVDVVASIGEMSFERVWRNRVEARVGCLTIPFISKADLIDNKRQVGHMRDLADIEDLTLIPVGEFH